MYQSTNNPELVRQILDDRRRVAARRRFRRAFRAVRG
jgi:hypothetical protein